MNGRKYRNVKFKLEQTLYFPKHRPLLFVSNAKVACTTIKKSIWTSTSPETFEEGSNPHDRVKGPFYNNLHAAKPLLDEIYHLTKFGLVRNPYSRFLSAFKDKIARPKRDPHVWRILSDRYGFDAHARPSMEDILECVLADDEFYVDQHFAKQSVNLSIGLIDYDYIGQLENMDGVSEFLRHHSIEVASHLKHSTGSSELQSVRGELSSRAIDLIQQAYGEDFANFGYSMDPDDITPVLGPTAAGADERILNGALRVLTSGTPEEFARAEADLAEVTAALDTRAIFFEKGFTDSQAKVVC